MPYGDGARRPRRRRCGLSLRSVQYAYGDNDPVLERHHARRPGGHAPSPSSGRPAPASPRWQGFSSGWSTRTTARFSRRRRRARAAAGRGQRRGRAGAAADVPVRRHRARQRHPRCRPRRRRRSGRRCGTARPTGSYGPCRAASTPWWASAAPPCPAGSGSGSPWPARSCAGRGCCCSTTPPAASTPRSSRRSWPACRHRLDRTPTSVLVVAYRKATIALADEVVFVDQGRVVARGPHERAAGRRSRATATWSPPTSEAEDDDVAGRPRSGAA